MLRAKDDGSALGRLIERSWKPLYFFVRRKGADVETAKDQVQAFFAHLLEVRLMDRVVQGRGRFRSFLLAAFDHFLANDYRLRTAEKRGGTSPPRYRGAAGRGAGWASTSKRPQLRGR